MKTIVFIKGGVTAPRGFLSGGIGCGIKAAGENDLAIVFSEKPCAAAGAFTASRVQAAPVKLDRERLRRGKTQAVVVNSGLANACTGAPGMRAARRMAAAAARGLGIAPGLVAVCSTGRIGIQLPIARIERGLSALAAIIKKGGNLAAARAIMTTDTRPKQAAVEARLDGVAFRVGGMAKGAGMIYPCLKVEGGREATMLAFITTDAGAGAGLLRAVLKRSLRRSFNRITVDGDMSTNDTVILMANGLSRAPVRPGSPSARIFQEAVDAVCRRLAIMIVEDGEGASRFVAVEVRAARSRKDASRAAAAVANSNLFKSALSGGTPNWGRLMAALGASGAAFREEKVRAWLGARQIIDGGLLLPDRAGAVKRKLRRPVLEFIVDLGSGKYSDVMYTCDLTPEYVEINQT